MFTRVIPLEQEPSSHPLWRLAESFGATCSNHLDAATTHVIAGASGTEKVRADGRAGLHEVLCRRVITSQGFACCRQGWVGGYACICLAFTDACCHPPPPCAGADGAADGQVGGHPRLARVQLHPVEAGKRGPLPGAAVNGPLAALHVSSYNLPVAHFHFHISPSILCCAQRLVMLSTCCCTERRRRRQGTPCQGRAPGLRRTCTTV